MSVKLFKEWEGKPCHMYKDVLRPWVEYTSVSTIKKHYCEEFDDSIAEDCATNTKYRLYGMTADEIRAEWEKEADLGKTHGTKIHAVIEKWIESSFKWGGSSKEDAELIIWFKSFAFSEKVNYNPLFTFAEKTIWLDVCSNDRLWTKKIISSTPVSTLREAILATGRVMNVKDLDAWLSVDHVGCACHYLLDVGLAGTIDIYREGIKEDFIDDIKTDKKFSMNGFNGRMMKGVLSHFPDSNAYQYFLQVNLYGFMNWRATGRKFGGGYIIHIPRQHDNYRKARLINIPNYHNEAMTVIADFFNLNTKSK